MARIVGVDLPVQKRVEIALTYIYGVGRTRSNSVLHRVGIDPDKKMRDLTDEEINRIRRILEEEGRGRRRVAQGSYDEHPAAHRGWFLPRGPPPQEFAGAGTANSHQRPNPERATQGNGL